MTNTLALLSISFVLIACKHEVHPTEITFTLDNQELPKDNMVDLNTNIEINITAIHNNSSNFKYSLQRSYNGFIDLQKTEDLKLVSTQYAESVKSISKVFISFHDSITQKNDLIQLKVHKGDFSKSLYFTVK